MAYAAATSALDAESQGSLKLTTSLSRSTSLHRVVTPLSSGPIPTSASSYAPSPTSTPASAYPGPNTPNAFTPADTPPQPASEGLHARANGHSLPTPAPLELGEAMMAVPEAPGVGVNDPAAPSKAPGLMRRISRGAANKLTRRRQSASQNDKRDRSSGPVIMRRRSDSNKTGPQPPRDNALESGNEEESNEALDGLGAWAGSEPSSLRSESRMMSDRKSVV